MTARIVAIAVGTCLLVHLPAGCAVPAGDQDAESGASAAALLDSSVLDADALDRALANQERLEAAGFELVGRAWLSARSYTGFYATPEGGLTVLRFTAPEDLARAQESQPIEHEAFADYVTRLAADGPARLVDLENDRLLYAPATASADPPIGGARAAPTPLEEVAHALNRCRESSRSVCNPAPGYIFNGRGPQVLSTWDRFQVSSHVGSARGTSYALGVCAHANGATVDLRYGRIDWGTAPPNQVLDIGPLEQFTQLIFGYWTEWRTCSDENVWGTCTGWGFELEFEHMDMRFAASGKNGGILHSYCGAITQNSNLYYIGKPKDYWCAKRGDCPVPNR